MDCKIGIDWYVEFDTSRGEGVESIQKVYRVCVYDGILTKKIIERDSGEKLARYLGELSGIWSEDFETRKKEIGQIFTQQNGVEIKKDYVHHFSYAIRLGATKWRQGFMFNPNELFSFKNLLYRLLLN